MGEIVIPRRLAYPIVMVLSGAMLVALGAVLTTSRQLPLEAAIFFIATGAFAFLPSAWLLLVRPPYLRATVEGVRFGSGRLLAWSEIKEMFPSGLEVQTSSFSRTRTVSVAFVFHRWQTMLWLPPNLWLARILSVGDVDVPVDHKPAAAAALVAKLEALEKRGTVAA